ncbi:hypothetical protein ACF1DV_18310 [Streptomyces achromogenes]|uniref:hypothetical protein n=1 Tax=Streptomyces achromogenes TaxID=67255 RepID=UPI0036F6710F
MLRDRLNQLGLGAADKSWINGITVGQSGGSSSYGAYTALAQWWSLAVAESTHRTVARLRVPSVSSDRPRASRALSGDRPAAGVEGSADH